MMRGTRLSIRLFIYLLLFFFTDTATTEIYTLSLHDALPISRLPAGLERLAPGGVGRPPPGPRHRPPAGVAGRPRGDRKSTRLNSSHTVISYAVFCLKKKKGLFLNDEAQRETQVQSPN